MMLFFLHPPTSRLIYPAASCPSLSTQNSIPWPPFTRISQGKEERERWKCHWKGWQAESGSLTSDLSASTPPSHHLGCLPPSSSHTSSLEGPCNALAAAISRESSQQPEHPVAQLATALFTTAKAVRLRKKQNRKIRKPCNKVTEETHPGCV